MGKTEPGSKEQMVGVILSDIYQIEKQNNSNYTVFDITDEPKELYEHFVKLKLLLHRIEFDLPGEDEFYTYSEQMHVSQDLTGWIVRNNLIHKRIVCTKLSEAYKRRGKSEEAAYFRKLQTEVEDL